MYTRNTKKSKEWDKNLSKFMDMLLSGDIRTKSAAEVGYRSVEYFRGVDFSDWLIKNNEKILAKHGHCLPNLLANNKNCEELGDLLIKNGFIYKADYARSEASESDHSGATKPPKWPKRLKISPRQKFEENGFYVIVYEGNKSWDYIILSLIILAVLVLCMFPAWPMPLKIGVWYLSVVLMSVILCIIIIRLILFVLVWFMGADFWLFPNLFNDDVGFFQAYFPLYEFSNRKDNWLMLFSRITCFILVAISIHQLGKTHSPSDVGNFASQSFFDILEWGQLKLGATPETHTPDLPTLQPLDNVFDDTLYTDENQIHTSDTDNDLDCLKSCGYNSIDFIMQKCLFSCECLKGVKQSECFDKCDKVTQALFDEAILDTC